MPFTSDQNILSNITGERISSDIVVFSDILDDITDEKWSILMQKFMTIEVMKSHYRNVIVINNNFNNSMNNISYFEIIDYNVFDRTYSLNIRLMDCNENVYMVNYLKNKNNIFYKIKPYITHEVINGKRIANLINYFIIEVNPFDSIS